MAYQIFQLPKAIPLASGVVLPGAKAEFFLTTTSTPTDVYTTSARNIAHTQPVVADTAGVLPAIYLDPDILYKVTLTNSADVLYYTQDPVNDSILSQAGIGAVLYPQTAAELAAAVTPTFYNYQPGDIRRYGAVGDNSTNCATAIQSAINVAEVSGGEVFVPTGIFRFTSALLIDNSSNYAVHLHGESPVGSTLRKAFSGTGIEIDNHARATIENLTLDKTGVDAGVGILVTSGSNQMVFRNIVVSGQGSHGIEIIEANLCTVQDVLTLSNGGDGIKVNGASTPDVNACTFINIDSRGNTGWGFNIDDGWANFGLGLTLQSNTAGGLRMNNARQNCLQVYSESNSGPQISLIDTADCKGNDLTVLEGTVTYGGTTADRNSVKHVKRGAVFDPNYNKVTADKFILPNGLQDGSSPQGILTISHTSNNLYDMIHSGSSSDGRTSFSNADGAFKHRLDADVLLVRKAADNSGAGEIMIGGTTQSTVGAAGAASPLPVTPSKYWIVNEGGVAYVVPLYLKS